MHTRPPVADYQCARCPHTDAGTGPDGIHALYQRITQHHETCPGRGGQHEAPATAGARKGTR
ncbi:hypothetical protein [Streptomyces sp. WMMC897]|uniref:hypothetical protein n=1 Tax=Streptomyces sp. WMMC897 TaxID=3014782 RepID=UPI0022B6F6BC|nr:hypothetical protein [Streptomyces sp. WMMC897]MCZ7413116.1 hypothetical protein [Streptomyces sp. WMMC897]MCZ7415500.1 hypothetical protein [Streptomyces sp. WMMC897]